MTNKTVVFSRPGPLVVLVDLYQANPIILHLDGSVQKLVSSKLNIWSGLSVRFSSWVTFSRMSKYSYIMNALHALTRAISMACGFLYDNLCRLRNP